MRKGSFLWLTTKGAALFGIALLASSAMAVEPIGPRIGMVPDVYITQNLTTYEADISTSANMFRYSDALPLWDYITPGDILTSDGIYWAFAIRKADLCGGYGSYLTGDNSHYSINGALAAAITGNEPYKDSEWISSVNSAAIQSVADGGYLTLRNIRISPEPWTGVNYIKTPDPGAPAGYLDLQEATIFVTDKATSPSYDRFLIATVDWGVDDLGIFNYCPDEKIYSNFASEGFAFGTFSAAAPFPASPATGAVDVGNMTINCPLANEDFYGQVSTDDANAFRVVPDKLYRFKVTMKSTNSTVAANPDIRIFLNGKANGVGQGQLEISNTGTGVAPYDGGPTTTPSSFSAYLWPCEAGVVKPGVMCYDSSSLDGGVITISHATIQSTSQAALTSETVTKDLGNGAADGPFEIASKKWSFYGGDFGSWLGYTGGSLTYTSAKSSGVLLIEGVTGTVGMLQGGLTQWGARNVFTATEGKLVVVKATAAGSQQTAQSPDVRIFLSRGNYCVELYVTPTVGSGLPISGKDFYAVFEVQNDSMAGDWNVGLQTTCLRNGITGTVQFRRLTVIEYPLLY